MLSDDLVRLEQNRLRNRYADLLRRFQVDHQLELRRLFHGKICRLGALENFVDVSSGAAEQINPDFLEYFHFARSKDLDSFRIAKIEHKVFFSFVYPSMQNLKSKII
jgi:hypothetical protein